MGESRAYLVSSQLLYHPDCPGIALTTDMPNRYHNFNYFYTQKIYKSTVKQDIMNFHDNPTDHHCIVFRTAYW